MRLVILLFTLIVAVKNQRLCYSCNQREKPNDCESVSTCSAGQQCLTDLYISAESHRFYQMKCVDSKVCQLLHGKRELPDEIARDKRRVLHACTKCCDSDYCNKNLCISHVTPVPRTQCYQCNDLTDPSQCENVHFCNADEECFSEEFLNDNGEFRVNLGCQRKLVCDKLAQVMKQQSRVFGRDTGINHICNGCCNTNNCNRQACKNMTNAFVSGIH